MTFPVTDYRALIKQRGLSIYDPVDIGSPYWIPANELEKLLRKELVGKLLGDLPIRSRSKMVKALVCTAMGYEIPSSFKRCRPRFPGQHLDVYAQRANNLQIWNDDISPTRRYVVVGIDHNHGIHAVRVITGADLSAFDTTGTQTQKYQARFIPGAEPIELAAAVDTANLGLSQRVRDAPLSFLAKPTDTPNAETLLPIAAIVDRLSVLVGESFDYIGRDQERNRGAVLHALACQELGYRNHHDDGRFPDIRHQLLEVKLQTSPTIDLGLVLPSSEDPLDIAPLSGRLIRPCDVRYAVFYGKVMSGMVTLTHLVVTNGASFFWRFQKFEGRGVNRKIQLHLPVGFFNP